MTATTPDLRVDTAELARRTIRRSDYVSCNQAFIDSKTPGSDRKENYSIIGPGVTQSAAQVVNLTAPHGFSIGAAAMPNGVTNNLHLHFTAEVFVNARGRWLLRWGVDGTDGEYLCQPGDVVSIPTWVFRGFTNVGPDDGWLFTVLGGDNTGGIVWAPPVLEDAARHGLYLSADNQLIDTSDGRPLPDGIELIEPIPIDDLAALRRWSADDLRSRVVTQEDLRWSPRPFLCSDLPGGGAELALVIGYGITEDRDQEPPISYPHGFSLAWLRAEYGGGLLRHRHAASQAVIVRSGRWRVTLNRAPDAVSTEIAPDDTMSIPAGAWRQFEVVSDEPGQLLVVTGEDGRTRLKWDDQVHAAAREKGLALDAAGYVAPWQVVRMSVLDN